MRRSSISRGKQIENARWRSARFRGGGVHQKSQTYLHFWLRLLSQSLWTSMWLGAIRHCAYITSAPCFLTSKHKNSDRGDPPPGPETQIHRSTNRTQRKREQVAWLCVSPEPHTDPLLLDHPSRRNGVDLCFATKKHRSTPMERWIFVLLVFANAPPLKNSMGGYTFTSLGS